MPEWRKKAEDWHAIAHLDASSSLRADDADEANEERISNMSFYLTIAVNSPVGSGGEPSAPAVEVRASFRT